MLKRARFFFNADTATATAASTGSDTSPTLLSSASDGSSQHSDTTTAPPAASFQWAGEDGTFSPGWLDKLPEDMRGNPSLKVIGSLPDLAKNYIETKSLTGKKLEAPGENATPEQIANWRKVVGAPENPEGYLGEAKTLRPDTVPEAFWDAEAEKQFLSIAHKHHLSPAAVKDIIAYHGNAVAGGLQKASETETQVLAAEGQKLRQAWGTDYDANLSLASRVAQTVGLDPNTHPVFTSAEMVQAFAKFGKLLSEDKLVTGTTQGIAGSIGEKIRDITDPQSNSVLAREYRGEYGPERQEAAQKQYHQLLNAQAQK